MLDLDEAFDNPDEVRDNGFASAQSCIRMRMFDGDRDGGWADEDRDDFDSGDSGEELLRSDSCRFRQFIIPEGDRDALPDPEFRSWPGSDGDRFMGLVPQGDLIEVGLDEVMLRTSFRPEAL